MNGINERVTPFLAQGNEVLNAIGDRFSERCFDPLLKASYHAGGELISKITGCAREIWTDPFSSGKLLTCFKSIENLSCRLAKRKPLQLPFLHFLDQSFVSSAQHLYAYIKEVNHLLLLPRRVEQFVQDFSFDHFMEGVSKTGGKTFVFLNSVRLELKKTALALLDYLIQVVDFCFQCLFLSSQFALLGYLKEIVVDARAKIHGKFSDRAIKTIHKRETRIRKEIVANVADFTTHYITSLLSRVSIKTGLGLAAYFSFEDIIHSTYPVNRLAMQTIAGLSTCYLLWRNVYQPYLNEYYQAYKQEFDPDLCNLKEFLNRYYVGYLYYPIAGTKNFLYAAE